MSNPQDDDEDAGFLAGFDSTVAEPSGDRNDPFALADDTNPSPAPAPAAAAPAPADSGAEQQPQEPAVDPFAGLPQAVRDLLGQVPSLVTEVQTLRRTAGMVPTLQSEVDRLKRAQAAPPSQEATPHKPLPKVAALREQGLDDIADALDEISQSLPHGQPAPAEPEPAAPTPAPAAPAPAAAPAASTDPVFEILDDMRPTWTQDLFSTECQLWLSHQPAEFQQTVRSTNSPKVILGALAKFDEFKGQTQATQQSNAARQRRMAAAATPRGDGRANRAPAQGDDEDADMQAGFYGR